MQIMVWIGGLQGFESADCLHQRETLYCKLPISGWSSTTLCLISTARDPINPNDINPPSRHLMLKQTYQTLNLWKDEHVRKRDPTTGISLLYGKFWLSLDGCVLSWWKANQAWWCLLESCRWFCHCGTLSQWREGLDLTPPHITWCWNDLKGHAVLKFTFIWAPSSLKYYHLVFYLCNYSCLNPLLLLQSAGPPDPSANPVETGS